jgi:putative DNA primase/helicase
MSYPEAYSRFFESVEGLKTTRDGWMARCPAHEDNKPSLAIAISPDTGNLLVKCWAGCRFKDIVLRLCLEEKDFFMEADVKQEIECTYDYCWPKGKLVFQVVRFKPKGFRQRRPAPNFDPKNPEWLWNLEGVQTCLYKSPELQEEIEKDKGRRVLVTEGEKDVDELWRLGFVATTNPQGAGKWKDFYSDQLAGMNVVVIPDEDEPGLNHAAQVVKSLTGKAKSVTVARLPRLTGVKTDVSAWLATFKDDAAKKQAIKTLVMSYDGQDPMIVLAPPCSAPELLALATKLVCGVQCDRREFISALALLRQLEASC